MTIQRVRSILVNYNHNNNFLEICRNLDLLHRFLWASRLSISWMSLANRLCLVKIALFSSLFHREAHTIGLMLIGISCMCLITGTVLMIVYFICVGGKRRTNVSSIFHCKLDKKEVLSVEG